MGIVNGENVPPIFSMNAEKQAARSKRSIEEGHSAPKIAGSRKSPPAQHLVRTVMGQELHSLHLEPTLPSP